MNAVLPVVGQQVYILRSGTYELRATLAAVVKVTPSGQVTLRNVDAIDATQDRRFNARGNEIGESSNYTSHFLDWDVERRNAILTDQKLRGAAANALNAVTVRERRVEPTWGTDSMRAEIERLEALVATARAAVNLLKAD